MKAIQAADRGGYDALPRGWLPPARLHGKTRQLDPYAHVMRLAVAGRP